MEQSNNIELNYPPVNTWFICWDDNRVEITSYDLVLPIQCMVTPWNEVDYYTNEAEWLKILIENGINPDLDQ